jgi:hypothetical protein
MFLEKLKLIGFFFVGIYSYIHRAFIIYVSLIEVFANFLAILLFKHDDVVIHIVGKWDVSPIKIITYITHFLIVVFLYILLF